MTKMKNNQEDFATWKKDTWVCYQGPSECLYYRAHQKGVGLLVNLEGDFKVMDGFEEIYRGRSFEEAEAIFLAAGGGYEEDIPY